MVETGQYWLEGFSENRFRLRPTGQLPSVDVIMPESDVSCIDRVRGRPELIDRHLTIHWQCTTAQHSKQRERLLYTRPGLWLIC